VDTDQIRASVKHCIASVANIDPASITDDASYKRDLSLDSLMILEIAVDTERQFRITITNEELSCIQTVNDTVRLVQQRLCGAAA
jgi:acyl carrier protein